MRECENQPKPVLRQLGVGAGVTHARNWVAWPRVWGKGSLLGAMGQGNLTTYFTSFLNQDFKEHSGSS